MQVKSLKCPFVECKYHTKIIQGPVELLIEHIYRDHDYTDCLKLAVEVGIIENEEERRAPKWLAEKISMLGTYNFSPSLS